MALKRLPQLVLRAYVAQCLLAISAYATWTVTSFYALGLTTSTNPHFTSIKYTETASFALKSDADPTGKPFSTSTYLQWGENVEVVEIFYSKNNVDASDIQATTTTATTDANTDYLQEVVFTAPASCPTPFTVTTYTSVNIPGHLS
ncbi:hypothetical protein EDB81DRAFT_890541 [Dactylonectria macrodidyma]|uniref:Uncharacterized protein n=1 Tax=Dactylonectria macrodidyma TaxID=307937 RepID=A0A9P9IJH7_9HYPO|nr:hypothetical protein EDB81DRAFT_890541 [Dactylonectria macrodidyma]